MRLISNMQPGRSYLYWLLFHSFHSINITVPFSPSGQPSHLEHLCINLCSETMQHFYNTHIFKSSLESCREEGIACEVEVEYVDNVPCIDLISSLVRHNAGRLWWVA